MSAALPDQLSLIMINAVTHTRCHFSYKPNQKLDEMFIVIYNQWEMTKRRDDSLSDSWRSMGRGLVGRQGLRNITLGWQLLPRLLLLKTVLQATE